MIEDGPIFWVDPRLQRRAGPGQLKFLLSDGCLKDANSARSFLLIDSAWLRSTLDEHQIGPEANRLSGQITLSWSGAESDSLTTPSASVQIDLDGDATVECVRCLEPFQTSLSLHESYALVDGEEKEGDYLLSPQGIALDALLLDAIECALPDYPRCPDGCADHSEMQ